MRVHAGERRRRGAPRPSVSTPPAGDLASAFGPVTEPARELAAELDPSESAQWVSEQALQIVFPDRIDDPLFRDALLRSSDDKLDAMWRIIAGRAELDQTTPLGALAFAETAAEVGVTVSQLERAYRVGTGLVWSCWYRAAIEYHERTDVPLGDLIGAPSMLIHAYLDRVLSPVTERFDATRAGRTREHLRRSILRQALDGSAALEDADIEEALGFAVNGEHVAVVLRGERPDRNDLIEYVRRSCGASSAVAYRHGVDVWVVWLSRADGFGTRGVEQLREALKRTGAGIAIGEPCTGVEGIGATGRDALEASRLQELLKPPEGTVLSYADVRLEALFLAEPARARRFVADELGPLNGAGARLRCLRDTALVWLLTGSHVGTAATIGIHEHTVRNRIAQCEELLGRALTTRRTELLVALRLERMLSNEG